MTATPQPARPPGPPDPSHPWDDHAAWWQDGFTDGVDPEYVEQIVPLTLSLLPQSGVVVDIGMGEGQVARAIAGSRVRAEFQQVELSTHSQMVIGLDPSMAQVRAAAVRGGGVSVATASAEALPLPDASADAAVACLVFEHIADVSGAISEVARVLRPDGRFVFLLNHPLLSTPGSGWIDDQILDPPEQYWRVGPYLPEQETWEEVQRGVRIRFFHRPLSVYVNALAGSGLVIDRMLEPPPPPGFLARAEEYRAAADIPRLLVLVARRVV